MLAKVLSHVSVDRLNEGSFHRPAKIEAASEGARRQARPVCPLCYGQDFPVPSNPAACPRVIRLLYSRGPAAVSRPVVTVVTDPIKGLAFGARSQVAQKVLELQPVLADLNPTATVVVKVRIFRV